MEPMHTLPPTHSAPGVSQANMIQCMQSSSSPELCLQNVLYYSEYSAPLLHASQAGADCCIAASPAASA
jgi:hypothetical protein